MNNTQVFYYKIVAKTIGKLFSIYDGKTEYILGKEMYEEARENHKGGFYVYSTIDQAIFADVPFKKGGLYFAPRTIIKCVCRGSKLEYGNGKIAFSYLTPISDLGMPKGYISTKAGMKNARVKYAEEIQKNTVNNNKNIIWKKSFNQSDKNQYKPMQAYTISLKSDDFYQKKDPKIRLQSPLKLN